MIDVFRGKYAFLSNFYEYTVCYDGMDYKSNEHAYQAAKTLDLEERKWVAEAPTAGEAKKRGQKVTMRPDWEQIKINVMIVLINAKFNTSSSDTTMVQQLIDTGTEELIEGNWWKDTFWGICNGKGKNWLGRILMGRRQEINIQKMLKTVFEDDENA